MSRGGSKGLIYACKKRINSQYIKGKLVVVGVSRQGRLFFVGSGPRGVKRYVAAEKIIVA